MTDFLDHENFYFIDHDNFYFIDHDIFYFIDHDTFYFHHCFVIDKRWVLKAIIVLRHGGKEYKHTWYHILSHIRYTCLILA